jgi:predicted transcriptional regulator
MPAIPQVAYAKCATFGRDCSELRPASIPIQSALTSAISPVTVYDAYTIHRTQIYLDERQLARLKSEARATHRTVSDIIRSAIEESLDRPDQSDRFEEALASVAGIWADRPDVGDTDEYVRKLRRDRRSSHLR